MSLVLTDRSLATLCVAASLLPRHGALLTVRARRLVAAAERRFVRDGRRAEIRARHWAVIEASAARLRAAELEVCA